MAYKRARCCEQHKRIQTFEQCHSAAAVAADAVELAPVRCLLISDVMCCTRVVPMYALEHWWTAHSVWGSGAAPSLKRTHKLVLQSVHNGVKAVQTVMAVMYRTNLCQWVFCSAAGFKLLPRASALADHIVGSSQVQSFL